MLNRVFLTLVLVFCLASLAVSAQEEAGSAAESAPRPLKVWLPAPLISDESGEAFQLLNERSTEFTESYGIPIEYRIKDVGRVGGIMATIRAGSDVAPGALPDITLIRRRDFSPSQVRQHLHSMESLFSSSIINDLGNGLEFGQIPLEEGVALYGLPYLFDVLLVVETSSPARDGYNLSFDDVLSSGANFLFPAARTSGLNQTFYLQYLSAGGLTPSDGAMSIDEAALRGVLQFYEDLTQRELITADVLSYQTPAAYLADFVNRSEQPQLAIFNASDYLAMIDQANPGLKASNIPTPSGEGFSIRSGWLWVIVTPDLNRQSLAARFLERMMAPDFHARFAKTLYHLPSQPAILGDSLPESVDHDFFVGLLADAILPLPESEGGTAPRLMQEALTKVLHGDASAATATRQALSQFSER